MAVMCEAVVMCDQHGRLTLVDGTAKQLFPEVALAIGRSIHELPSQLDLAPPFEHLGLDQALLGHAVEGECALAHGDEQRTLHIRAAAVPGTPGQLLGAVTVIRDVTHERFIERMKDDFLLVAAHELKTPLTTLKGYTQLAIKRLGDDPANEKTRSSLVTIDSQADRIARLVAELLDVSRIQAGRLELNIAHFDVISLIQQTIAELETSSPGCHLRLTGPATLMVTADLDRVDQVLRNVLGNAIKYSDPQCDIAIEVRSGQQVEVIVTDHGVGVAPHKLPHIFEPWYQAHYGTDDDRGGLGLGLHIAESIVARHGGTMWATSSEGQGTTIGFTLPATWGDRTVS